MRKTIFLACCAVCLFSLAACKKLRCDECQVVDARALLFLSKTDSTDLILDGHYALDSLRITPIRIDTTMPGAGTRIEFGANGTYYNALFWADKNTSGYVIQLDSLPPDTLFVSTFELMPTAEDCCPGFTAFEMLTMNGDTLPNDWDDVTIRIFK